MIVNADGKYFNKEDGWGLINNSNRMQKVLVLVVMVLFLM